jgi:hypothetical protein
MYRGIKGERGTRGGLFSFTFSPLGVFHRAEGQPTAVVVLGRGAAPLGWVCVCVCVVVVVSSG